jgi:hypothetical protein
MEKDDLQRFDEDIQQLVNELAATFKSEKSKWFLHEETDTLYVELQGLEDLSEDEIEALATPILDEVELDLEEIILMPLS